MKVIQIVAQLRWITWVSLRGCSGGRYYEKTHCWRSLPKSLRKEIIKFMREEKVKISQIK